MSEVTFSKRRGRRGQDIPLAFFTFAHVDETGVDKTFPFSAIRITDPSGYYGGSKSPSVTSFGAITRALSDRVGLNEGSAFDVVCSDQDQSFRRWLGNRFQKYLPNREGTLYMTTDAERRARLGTEFRLTPIALPVGSGMTFIWRFRAREQGGDTYGTLGVDNRNFGKGFYLTDDGGGNVFGNFYDSVDNLNSTPIPADGSLHALACVVDAAGDATWYRDWVADGTFTYTDLNLDRLFSNDVPEPLRVDLFDEFSILGADLSAGQMTALGAIGTAAAYDAAILGYSPIIFLKCEEAEGPYLVDSSGNGHTATLRSDRKVTRRVAGAVGDPSYGIATYADATPRIVGRGVAQSAMPKPGMSWRFSMTDPVTLEFDNDLPRRLVSTNWFSNAPDASIGKAEPIVCGSITGSNSPTDDLGHRGHVGIYVGTVVISAVTYYRVLVASHASTAINHVYVDGVNKDATFGITIFAPGQAGWIEAHPYVDVTGSNGVVRRYTLVYMTGPDGSAVAAGTSVISFDIDGIEDVGDGSGSLITDLAFQYQHCLEQFVFQDYQTGSWASPPAWSDATPLVNAAQFAATKALLDDTGSYPGAFALTTTKRVRDVLADFNASLFVRSGFDRQGRYGIWMVPDRSDYYFAQVMAPAFGSAPIAYWRLNEKATTVGGLGLAPLSLTDSSGNGHTATLSSSTGIVYGMLGVGDGRGMRIEPTAHHASLTPIAMFAGADGAIKLWLWPSTAQGFGGFQAIAVDSATGAGLYTWWSGSDLYLVYRDSADLLTDYVNATPLTLGRLNQIILSIVAESSGGPIFGSLSWIVNGKLDKTDTVPVLSGFSADRLFNSSADAMPLNAEVVDEITFYDAEVGLDAAAADYAARHTGDPVTETTDILAGSFDYDDDMPSLANVVTYGFGQFYWGDKAGQPLVDGAQLHDQQSVVDYKKRLESPPIQYPMLRDAATALLTATRQLEWTKDPARIVVWAEPLTGLNYDFGDLRSVTHREGPGARGYDGARVQITGMSFDPTRLRVDVTAVRTSPD